MRPDQIGTAPSIEPPARTFTERARRAQITRAAALVLAEAGYAGTSMAAIAARLGISKGVISYHFDGKADLLRAVVSDVLEAAAAWMTPTVASAPSYTAALHAYLASNLGFLKHHRTDISALTEILANARAIDGVPELYGAAHHDAVAALEQLLEGGQRAGEFSAFPTGVLAISLRASIDAASSLLRDNPHFDLDEFERGLAVLYGRAVGAALEPTRG